MAKKKTTMNIIGTTGLKHSGGLIIEEFLPRLQGINGVRLYTEMSENNSIIGSVLFIIDMIVRQVKWRVETQEGMEGNPKAIKEKEFLESCLKDMSGTWEDLISECLSMLVFGWSFFEIVYKVRRGETGNKKTNSIYDDGKWGWRKIEIRSQDSLFRWIFDEENDVIAMHQLDLYSLNRDLNSVIPIEKSILFRTKNKKGNPEGFSLLRPAVRDWFFLKRLQEIEAVGIERDLTGMPIFEVPPSILLDDASESDKNIRSQLEMMIQQIRVDERWGALIPSETNDEGKSTGYKFRLQTTGGKKAIDTNPTIKRYESRIAMVFMAEFIMMGMDRVGAQSADESKKNMFKLALETILSDMIASTFNRYAVNKLMKLNKVSRELWPRVVPASLDSPDLDKMGKFIEYLSKSGILSPNKKLEEKLLSDARLPIPSKEETDFFDDPSVITPRDSKDQTSGLISQGQIDSILKINEAIKNGSLSRSTAIALAASTLGVDISEVDKYLIDEPTKEEEKTQMSNENATNNK